MKPIKLTMNAFGPFAKEQEVDFEKLQKSPLFLINGATGAGKTTILDAICYALYDETSGEDTNRDRDARQMRSHYADSEEATYVALEFSVNDAIYFVKRSPEQEIPKKRGEGSTKKATEAILKKKSADGSFVTIATKSKEVTSQIEEIIGLKSDQFRQIIVLPQGKFRKMLQSDSKEKQEILKTLFSTELFRRTEEILKSKSSELKGNLSSKFDLIDHLLASINEESSESLDNTIRILTEEIDLKKGELDEAARSLKSARDEQMKAQEDLSKLKELEEAQTRMTSMELQKEEMEEKKTFVFRLKKASEFSEKLDVLRSYQKNYLEEKEKFELCEDSLNRAAEKERMAEEKFLTLSNPEYTAKRANSAKRAEELAKLKEELEAFLEKRNLLSKAQEEFEEITAINMRLLDNVRLEREKAENIRIKIEEMKVHQSDVSSFLSELSKTKENILQVQRALSLKEHIESLDQNFLQVSAEFKKTDMELSDMEADFKAYQIALLEASLLPGEPCPVCGSLEHPKAQTLNFGHEVDFDKLDSLKKDKNEKDEFLSQLRVDIASKKGQLEELSHNIETSLEDTLSSLVAKESDLEINIEKAQKKAQLLMQLQGELQTLIEKINAQEDMMKDVAFKVKVAEEKYITQKAVFDSSVPHDLQDISEESLQTELAEAVNINSKLFEEFEKAGKELENAKIAVSQESFKIELLRGSKDKAEANLQSAEKSLNDNIYKAGYSSLEELLAVMRHIGELEQVEKEVNDYYLEIYEAEKRLERAQTAALNIMLPNLEAIQRKVEEAESLYEEASKTFANESNKFERMKAIRLKIDEVTAQSGELEREFKTVSKLSDVANGKNNYGLTFERFVLGSLLDEVLEVASKRFSHMSNGRYSLERTMKRLRKDAAGGLEIDVVDSYTGKNRSVSTLSGGEGFKASLAMALALADVVQTKSGGIHLDTIFVDEGFGSLDAESLDSSIKVLMSINELGRMVGIISHVPELKERITSRIEVESDFVGSKISVIAGY